MHYRELKWREDRAWPRAPLSAARGIEVEMHAGDAFYLAAFSHAVETIGSTEVHLIGVELK